MSERPLRVYVLIVLAMLLWGLSFVWSAIVFEYLTPMATILARLVISSLLLIGWLLLKGRLSLPGRKDLGRLLVLATLQPFLYFVGEAMGLKRSTPVIAAIVIALIPVFTPLASALTRQERLGLRNVLGILISFGGVMLIVTSGSFRMEASYSGLAFLMLAVFAAVAYTIYVRRINPGMGSIEVITWQNTIGVFLFLPFVLIFDLGKLPLSAPDLRFAGALLSLAVLASSLAFIFYFSALRSLGPSKANAFTNAIPVFTAVFAWLVLGEVLSLNKILGMAVVIAGVLLSQSGRKKSVLIPGG